MAATEDRIDVYTNVLDRRVIQDLPLATGEVLYAKTLAQINSSGELEELDHTDSEDDSGVSVRAILQHMEEDEGPISNLKSRYPGSDPVDAECYSGILMEFEITEADTTGYSLDGLAYAVDNETVADDSADGSGGTYATVGPVYAIDADRDRVTVLVQGISA